MADDKNKKITDYYDIAEEAIGRFVFFNSYYQNTFFCTSYISVAHHKILIHILVDHFRL